MQKVSLGQTVEAAVEEIIARCTIEVRKNAFEEKMPWTRAQAWSVVSLLASKGEANYYGLLHGSAFAGDETALKALEQSEIISVYHVFGRASKVKAGRPVYQKALERLVEDRVFADTHNYLDAKVALKESEGKLRVAEEEFKDIGLVADSSVAKGNEGIKKRAKYLDGKMKEEQSKIEGLEIKLKVLKERLEKEMEKFD